MARTHDRQLRRRLSILTENHRDTWRPAYEHLLDALTTAQGDRNLRSDIDSTGKPAWIAHEINLMHDETNRLRARLGRGPVSPGRIDRADQMACGHVDYTTKFAIYCADLVTSDT